MSFDYAKTANTADRLITKFGQAVTLRVVTVGTYDPATGTASNSTADHSGYGTLFDYKQSEIDGTLIKEGDQRLLLSPYKTDGAAMPVPTTTDKIVIGSTVYTIQPSGKVSPAGTNVMFDLHLRGT